MNQRRDVSLNFRRSPKVTAASIEELIRMAANVQSDLMDADELWILVDCDAENHKPEAFQKLMKWEAEDARHHVAVSSPRFEYWLLLHFEDSPSLKNALSDSYLDQYLPGYSKSKDVSRHGRVLTRERVEVAVKRELSRHQRPNCEHPEILGTEVAELVKRVLRSAE